MKVIEKGRPQKGWAKEFVCTGKGNGGGGCNAKLLVEYDDLFITSHTDMTGDRDIFTTFKCVECGVLTDIPSKESPHRTNDLPEQALWERQQIAKSVLHG